MKEEIKFDPKNFRIHNDRNKKVIRKSLEDCGAGRSVLMDKDNYLIAGNGVYEQAQELGIPVRIIETDGKELVVVKRKDLALGDNRRKLLALADNYASDTSEFDMDLVIENFSEDVLHDWEFSVDDIQLDAPDGDANKNESFYTKKIVSPIYTPTGEKPKLSELCNLERYHELLKRIRESGVSCDIEAFLAIAASRHIVFDYGKIAEFYAHADKQLQELMEDSALVIVDFNKAIELGYVCLKEELLDSYMEDHADDEE